MSKTIRIYQSLSGNDLVVTAYVGPNGQAAVQFTMSRDYAELSEAQVRDLIQVLEFRLKRVSEFTAMEWGEGERIGVNGKIVG